MTRAPLRTRTQTAWAVLVVLGVTAFGILAVRAHQGELMSAGSPLSGMPGAWRWYAFRWSPEILGWLVLAWAATRRLASTGSRAVHAPFLVGTVLVATSTAVSPLIGPGLVWAGPVGLAGGGAPAFSRPWWWAVAGALVTGAALVVTCWVARRGARPSQAPTSHALVEAGALVAIPLVSLALGAVALTGSAFGVPTALVVSGLPFLLVALAALAASGGGRTSTVAIFGGVLLVTGVSLFWRPAAYLSFFAAACALTLVPTARGIDWLTAPRRSVPAASTDASVAEGSDADDRARA